MPTPFRRVVIYGRQRAGTQGFQEALENLIQYLRSTKTSFLIETETAALLPKITYPTIDLASLQDDCDLMIVVGGDGSLLTAAHHAVEYNIPVVGINRGRLGFLTDILPQDIDKHLGDVLAGRYHEESRFLLHAQLPGQTLASALNDVVLMPGAASHMIEFEITIDGQFVSHQRADGLIVATPTGSTAYALSGGGPILHPSLEAMVLVPMFPHTLSSRPIVVHNDSVLEIQIAPHIEITPLISCDGLPGVSIDAGKTVRITRKKKRLRLIHPHDYNYYETLRSKLKWESK